MRLGVAAAIIDGQIVPGDVDIADGVVQAVGMAGAKGSGIAVAGFIDLQVNGFGGVDFLTADREGYARAGKSLLQTGVTAYQPTLITSAEELLRAALAEVAGAQREQRSQGERPAILGAHLEGPFIAPERMGTHPAKWRRDPDLALADRLLEAGPVTYMTLAPELPGALELIDHLVARGVVVACGHSDADASQAAAAFERGVRTTTHLFNAMRPLLPRAPGLAGAALAREDIVVQMIADGVHLAPELMLIVWRAAAGRVALVTDAVAAAGVGDGAFWLGETPVRVRDGVVRREDGVLAGSVLTMIDAVRASVALGVPLPAAVQAATAVPARVVGRSDLGRIAEGGPADIVVLDDRLEILQVLTGGHQA